MKVLNQQAQQSTPHANNEKSSHRTTFILIGIAVLLISLFVGIILTRQQQTTENKALEIGPTCPLDGFVCTWQKEEGVTYACTILEVTEAGTTVVANPDVTDGTVAGQARCAFTPQANKQYRCSVLATRFEGCATTVTGDSSCSTVSPTPTPSPTPTITPSPTPHPKCYVTTCNPQTVNHCTTLGLPNHTCVDTDSTAAGTDYRCISNTSCTNPTTTDPAACWCAVPTPTPTATPTPTVTTTTTPTATPTPTSTSTVTPTVTTTTTPKPTDIVVVNNTTTSTPAPTAGVTSTTTPVPTLPVAGLPQATYLILLAGIIVVVVGLAL